LEYDGYVNYFAHREIAFAVLEQMEKFKMTTIFTIPSMNKPGLIAKIVKKLNL
jgi:hypothetical protein